MTVSWFHLSTVSYLMYAYLNKQFHVGMAIIYIPGDQPGTEIIHPFNEGAARGRPPRPGKDDKNVSVKVSMVTLVGVESPLNLSLF